MVLFFFCRIFLGIAKTVRSLQARGLEEMQRLGELHGVPHGRSEQVQFTTRLTERVRSYDLGKFEEEGKCHFSLFIFSRLFHNLAVAGDGIIYIF